MTKHAQKNSVFSKRLMEARLRMGYTQAQLGVLAGIDEFSASARMNQYERGVHAPDYGMSRRLAEVLEIPTSFFFEEDDLLAALILNYGGLKAQQRKQLVKLSEELLDTPRT
jgi:transcriptional regulator with XRE-family HTH domain